MAGRTRKTSELAAKTAKTAARKLKAKGYERKGNVTLSLTVGAVGQLKKHCESEDITMSYVIDELLAAYLDELRKP